MPSDLLANLQQGDSLLLRLTTGILRDGANTGGTVGGEIQLSVMEVSERGLQVQLSRMGLYSTSVTSWHGTQGELGLSAQVGGGEIVLASAILTLSFEGDLTFAELTEAGYQNLVALENGSRVPPKRKFTGVLSGWISQEDAEGAGQLQSATLRLRESGDVSPAGHGVLLAAPEELRVEMAARVITAPPSPCPKARRGSGGVVKIRPIYFPVPDQDLPHTGRSFTTQLENANLIWRRCCLSFEEVPSITLPDRTPSLGGDRSAIVSAVVPRAIADEAVSVFFVETLAPGDGGGTLEGNTIILHEATARQKLFLLAHELGHLMGLPPSDVTTADIMNGSFVPPPPQPPNALSNCGPVSGFNKIGSRRDCCFDS